MGDRPHARFFVEKGDFTYQEPLTFNWFFYPEAGTYDGEIVVEASNKSISYVKIPVDASGKQIHIILEVTSKDSDTPLTSYRRIVMDVK